MPRLEFSDEARATLQSLAGDPSQANRIKAIRAALGKLETNVRHPGLNTHLFKGEKCPHGEKLWESYAQNNTPGAYRVFWCYIPAPAKDMILIVAITPHP